MFEEILGTQPSGIEVFWTVLICITGAVAGIFFTFIGDDIEWHNIKKAKDKDGDTYIKSWGSWTIFGQAIILGTLVGLGLEYILVGLFHVAFGDIPADKVLISVVVGFFGRELWDRLKVKRQKVGDEGELERLRQEVEQLRKKQALEELKEVPLTDEEKEKLLQPEEPPKPPEKEPTIVDKIEEVGKQIIEKAVDKTTQIIEEKLELNEEPEVKEEEKPRMIKLTPEESEALKASAIKVVEESSSVQVGESEKNRDV